MIATAEGPPSCFTANPTLLIALSENEPMVNIRTQLKVGARKAHNEPMVTNEKLRSAFADRLRKAMTESGQPVRGAAVRLHELTGKSANAAGKWLKGESMPTPENLQKICHWLNVREEWLEYGREPMRPGMASKEAYRVEERAQDLAQLASPRSLRMLNNIAEAAQDGRLTEDDLILLEQIATRIAARPANYTNERQNHGHERLKAKLGNNDSSTQGNGAPGPATKPDTPRD
ncbi:helix-turn-helix domain-containing protein [Vreelandella neptunia]|uniref:Helix-turn-helix transcriptional regulator n=1 Tax=Vreelandella neptunia TaxID=115551 RepID=A0ABZ0YSL6_9GAMM|nr:helix-turn-helix transcriptional regulator [Halomonas neptunia]MDN3561687.1 helix-turn-helix transcriptional regulator [Halomonas neptunia]WQH14589.1 helix-turn-helix transcriptional regulator [Halomonas neptunia]